MGWICQTPKDQQAHRLEMKMSTWRELRVQWRDEGYALFLPSAHNTDPCESLGLMSHVS